MSLIAGKPKCLNRKVKIIYGHLCLMKDSFSYSCYFILFQTLHLLLKPQGLKEYQQRPIDKGEQNIDNYNNDCKYSNGGPLDMSNDKDPIDCKQNLLYENDCKDIPV